MNTALIFSGQGSQYVGMAQTLYTEFAASKELIERANSVLGFSISDIMFNGPADVLTQTKFTQPALFVHEAAVLAAANAQSATSVQSTAHAVAGHSLGEYSALYAAGVLDFDSALRLVQLRGELMFAAGKEVPGTMAAVVGMDDDAVVALCDELNNKDGNVLVPANFNSPGQIVISGSAEYVRACMPLFKERGAKIVKELQVSGAFHSPLLASAQKGLSDALKETTFADANVDVYVNVSAQRLRSADALREAAMQQLTSPVRWTQTMQSMRANGLQRFIEIGPGKVLQGLVKRTIDGAEITGIDSAEDVQRFMQVSEENS